MKKDFETEPEYTKQLKCSECKNWKQVDVETLEYMEINEIAYRDYICCKCRKQEHLT